MFLRFSWRTVKKEDGGDNQARSPESSHLQNVRRSSTVLKRSELEHVIRAASAITLHDEFVIIGSQALLGEHPDAPDDLLVSIEADIYPLTKPEDSEVVDGSIGEGSTFQDTFGYYAHGVAPETATLPPGWKQRLVPVKNENTGGATGWCLETHDLAMSKLVAGREKDIDFVEGLLRNRLVDPDKIRDRLRATPLASSLCDLCLRRLERLEASSRQT